MAKGKYAARAANRLAQLDSELVLSLREELATVKDALRNQTEDHARELAERDATFKDRLESAVANERARLADALADTTATVQALRDDVRQWLRSYVAAVTSVQRDAPIIPVKEGVLDRANELFGATVEDFMQGGRSREIRRRGRNVGTRSQFLTVTERTNRIKHEIATTKNSRGVNVEEA